MPRPLLVSCVLAAACVSHPIAEPQPQPGVQTEVSYESSAKLDLLFVIDDSRSMDEEQKTLRENFPRFIEQLQRLPDGIPDLHVGVISTDFGAGPDDFDTCHAQGKRGRLLVKPGCGLDPARAFFLATDGRVQNFDGDLAAAFSCLADLGSQGCGFEHPLQAIRAALSNVNAENAGFLRPDAYLGIVVLSDEDDCSADLDAELFRDRRSGESSGVRCASRGHVCGGREVPAAPFRAPLASCRPYQRGDDGEAKRQRLINVEEIVAYVKAAKGGRAERVIVSVVTGWSEAENAEYAVVAGDQLDLAPICNSANGNAAPAVRLKSFADAFAPNASWHSICQADLRPAVEGIGRKFVDVLLRRCLPAPLIDVDPARPGVQPECSVTDRIATMGGDERQVVVPACGGGAEPCWSLVEDPACRFGQRIDVTRGAGKAATGTLASVKCLTR